MGITEEQVAELAGKLIEATEQHRPIEPIQDVVGVGNVDAAYAIQSACTDTWLARGRVLVGRKIGLTNPVVQQQLGVDQPDFGMLFDDMTFRSGDVVPDGTVLQPRIEAEMAFVLSQDLASLDLSVDDVAAAVAYVTPALEIVGSRIANWKISIVDTVADNASSGAFVLGEVQIPLSEIDLTGAEMEMTRTTAEASAEVVSQGTGAACLGSPLMAAHWLATEMVRRGAPLQAGDVILTGALGPMISATPGDSFRATISGLGDVQVAFE